jgi:hypothetical protein
VMSGDGVGRVCTGQMLEEMTGFPSLQLGEMVASEVQVWANTDSLAWKVLADRDSLAYASKVAWVVFWWYRNKRIESVGCGFVEYSLYGRSIRENWMTMALLSIACTSAQEN